MNRFKVGDILIYNPQYKSLNKGARARVIKVYGYDMDIEPLGEWRRGFTNKLLAYSKKDSFFRSWSNNPSIGQFDLDKDATLEYALKEVLDEQ